MRVNEIDRLINQLRDMTLPNQTIGRCETAWKILPARYFQRDESGTLIESLDGMFERVARAGTRRQVSVTA